MSQCLHTVKQTTIPSSALRLKYFSDDDLGTKGESRILSFPDHPHTGVNFQ